MLDWLIFLIGGALGFKGFDPSAAIALIAVLLLVRATGRMRSANVPTLALVVVSSMIFAVAAYMMGMGVALLLAT